ncbi:3-oxoacyl-ACP reductase [Mesorhizobium sp. L-8-10]|uniref:SDR family NAD(P)-dependent oxidoreductase n=1 Tax=unclassified Mesorhizobium TaxID=325217 RepID=UPI00192875A8|nr:MULTISPECIES: SDR family NAD(P)-dependent oxidoreductase [unclassified Mesorhizobium]BCH23009.1 3-oxoacyl-ACP reductase [Mesorhizobium sp. L-8-3]BCH30813.1 3-oxoacyl-ACP reductase [Mesorhizobium sp. L-8-10]
MSRFEGRSVLVTGATGGFGRRLAERLAADGARLVLSDIDPKALDDLAERLPGGAATLAGDVAREDLSEALVELAVKRFGQLDIAINNAGIAQSFVKLPQVPSDEARRIIEIDLLGVFYAMKHQIPVMEKQFRTTGAGGTIVNIASVAGLAGAARLSVYAAAKHGVVGLTRSAASEYATRGIRVNAVCPSFARTQMVGDFVRLAGGNEKDAHTELTRGVPMKRVAEVDEVVEVILFAADPKNSFMTGHTLSVDGGIMAI